METTNIALAFFIAYLVGIQEIQPAKISTHLTQTTKPPHGEPKTLENILENDRQNDFETQTLARVKRQYGYDPYYRRNRYPYPLPIFIGGFGFGGYGFGGRGFGGVGFGSRGFGGRGFGGGGFGGRGIGGIGGRGIGGIGGGRGGGGGRG